MEIDKERLFESDSFCIAPWIHLNLWPNGDIHPCCISDDVCGSVHKSSISEIWNSDEMKKIRLDMLNGVKRSGCSSCYIDEKSKLNNNLNPSDNYAKSRRFRLNNHFIDHIDIVDQTNEDGSLDKLNLIYWDLRISNVCNFKCRMCGPEFSTSWENELNLSKKKKIDFSSLSEQFDDAYQIVEEIYFAGGEPLIMDEHYQILDKLIEIGRTDVKISYSTNLSTIKYKDKDIIKYWNKFPNKNVYASIDGIGKRGELIRKGFNWDKFIQNAKILYESIPDFKLYVSCTIQALNCLHVFDLHRTLYENKIIKDIDDFDINYLKYPEYYAVQVLPKEVKKKFINDVKKYIEEYLKPNNSKTVVLEFVSLIKFIISFEPDEKTIENFVFHTRQMDLTRNENCRIIFPEFEESIWKYYC